MFRKSSDVDKGLISLHEDVESLCVANQIKMQNVVELSDQSKNEIDLLLSQQKLTTYSELLTEDEHIVAIAARDVNTHQFVGCVIINDIDIEKGTCHIDVIAATQQGVGSLLMLASTDFLADLGLNNFYLYAANREDDNRARTFYRKLKLEECKEESKPESVESKEEAEAVPHSKFVGTIPLSHRDDIIGSLKKHSIDHSQQRLG